MPEQPKDLEINLDYVPTEHLIKELFKRSECVVIARAPLAELDGEGDGVTCDMYGRDYECLGMAHKLLQAVSTNPFDKDFNGYREEDPDDEFGEEEIVV